MSILSDAWRRARGEEDAVTRALGAPPAQPGARRGHWLPWLLCCLLLAVVVGLGVYLWRSNLLTHAHPQQVPGVAAGKPAGAEAGAAQAGIGSAGGSSAGHAATTAVRTPVKASIAVVRAKAPATPAAHAGNVAAAPGTAPEAVRAQLPPLAVTVHVWNPRPASRFIVVGGRIYHEGDELSPGLRLVSITQEGEIVNFRGYLITLNGH